jgi:hypothetical protein
METKIAAWIRDGFPLRSDSPWYGFHNYAPTSYSLSGPPSGGFPANVSSAGYTHPLPWQGAT